jgi:predicted DNA-binding transcriptional regulator YafY
MLASRLLSILMTLQARGRASATELAKEFEVSVRTIHRDIDQLSAAGIPVYAERGRSGGFALMDGYRTKLTGLTQPEAESLFLAGLPGPAAQLGLADVLSAARLKLIAALPSHIKPGAERIAERFHLDPTPWFHGTDPNPALRPVAQAVWSAKKIKLRYRPAGESETRARTLSPLGLVLKGGVWYLVAQADKSVRTYRVANIHDAEIVDENFERPKKFDLAAHWGKSASAYEEGVYREEAEVLLTPRGLALLEMLGPYVKAAAEATAKPSHDGRTRCTIPLESGRHGLRELVRFLDDLEVVGPPELRAQMRDVVAEMSGNYKGSARKLR